VASSGASTADVAATGAFFWALAGVLADEAWAKVSGDDTPSASAALTVMMILMSPPRSL